MPPKIRPIKKSISLTSNPPQHAYENDPNHRSFLARSLSKSDTELYAIMKLNASLQQIKEFIISEFGLDVLLDVGEGKITLRKYVLGDNVATSGSSAGGDDSDGNNGEEGDESPSGEEGQANSSTTAGTKKEEGEGKVEEVDNEEVVFVNIDKDKVRRALQTMDDEDEILEEEEDDGEGNEEEVNEEENKEEAPKEGGEEEKDGIEGGNVKDDESKEEKEGDHSNKNDNTEDPNNIEKEADENDESKPHIDTTTTDTTTTSITTNPTELKYLKLKQNPTFQPTIKSFLLRLKLRRKLLNRLSRRLLRLSYAMDGKLHKINPPMLPKYGTSFEKNASLNVKDKVNEWNMDFECREEVLQKVWRKKDVWNKHRHRVKLMQEKVEMMEKEAKEAKGEEKGNDEEGKNIVVKEEEQEKEQDATVKKEGEISNTDTNTPTETEQASNESTQVKQEMENKKEDKNDEKDVEMKDVSTTDNSTNNNDNDVEMKDVTTTEEESIKVTSSHMDNKSNDDENNNNQKKPDPPEDDTTTTKTPNDNNDEESEEEFILPSKTEDEKETKAVISELSKLNTPFEFDPFLLDKEHQKNLEKLIEFDLDYAKLHTVHLPTSTIMRTTTALTKDALAELDKDEDDFDDTNGSNADGGSGGRKMIGAVSKFMTQKEKVMEWKRWQTEFLTKIPDQPTFQELTKRVFMLDERRKLCEEKDIEKDEEEKKEEKNEVDGEKNDEEKNEGKGGKSLKRKREDLSEDNETTEKNDDDNDDDEEKKKANAKKTADEIEASLMKQKRICLDPVPSFYQQDYSRILMIQSATLSAALSSNSRDTYLQAKNEYEQIFKRSHAIQQQKNDVEKELHKANYEFRMKATNLNQAIAMARMKWETEKKAFETQKIQRMQMKTQLTGKVPSPAVVEGMSMTDTQLVKRSLASAVDRVTIRTGKKEDASGTPHLASKLRQVAPDSVTAQVATAMSHCVDIVARRVETGWLPDAVIDEAKGGEQFPPFVPPATTNPDLVVMNASGETYTKLIKRLKSEISTLKSQLDASEAARSKAWSRLNKAKAAYNNRSGGSAGASSSTQATKPYRQKAAPTTTNKTRYTNPTVVQGYMAHQRPTQPQPRSTPTSYQNPAAMATNPAVASAAAAAAAVKANMGMNNAVMVQNTNSENKYSIDKVRARMYSDGSVLPVSEPKRGKDGLFLRPAGRQRKGMDWDGVNGKWVPQGSLN